MPISERSPRWRDNHLPMWCVKACHDPAVYEEEQLDGGNTTVVVRVGDTVGRPAGPWTPAVHDLLHHLSAAGFAGSPRVLGVDELDREILEFVPGEVGTLSPSEPLPVWFGSGRRRHVGRLVDGSASSRSRSGGLSWTLRSDGVAPRVLR